MRSQSSSVRKTNTPSLKTPCSSRTFASGGIRGLLPVAIISLSIARRASRLPSPLFVQIHLFERRAGISVCLGRVPRLGLKKLASGLWMR